MINFIKNKDESINLIAKEIMKEIKSMKNYGLSQSENCCFPKIVVNLGSYAEVYSHEVKRDNLILTVSSEIGKNKMAYANIYCNSEFYLYVEYFYQEESSYWNPSKFIRLCFIVEI